MKSISKYGAYILVLIPAIVFYCLFFRYTVDAPINDDYSILNFINKCISTDSIKEKLVLIVAQHNEHRIIYDRLWTILSYKIQKNVDFNVLALVGNLSLIGIAYLFYIKFKHLNKNILLFAPVTILIFNFASWENMTFPMAALSNFTVYLFTIASLYFLSKNTLSEKKNLWSAITFFFLALITQGGGLFVLPVSVLILVYKKEYKNLVIYGSVSLLLIALYFFGYQKPPQSGSVGAALQDLPEVFIFAFAFLGNAFNYFLIYSDNTARSITCTQIIGALFFVLFIYISFKKYYQRNIFIYSILAMVIVTSFATAVSRYSIGIETAGASRYRINSIIFTTALYFWLIETFPLRKKVSIAVITTVSIGYFLSINLRQWEYLSFREKQTMTGFLLYKSGNPDLLNCDRSDMGFYTKVLRDAKDLETYEFPDEALNKYFPVAEKYSIKGDTNSVLNLNINIDSVEKIADGYLIDGWSYFDGMTTNGQKVFVGLKSMSTKEIVFFDAKETPRFDLEPYFKKSGLEDGGFTCRISDNDVPKGEYLIAILVKNGNDTKIQETDKKLTIE